MDNFMDKIAQKLGAQEAIRANAAADAAQIERLEAQVEQYDACMKEMRKLNLKNIENEQKLKEMLEDGSKQLKDAMDKNSEQLETLLEQNGAKIQSLADECIEKIKSTQNETWDEAQNAVADAKESADEVRKLLEELKEANAGDKEKLEEWFKQSDEHVHKENVKVYRNVQAAVVEELEKQTQAILSSQQQMAAKNKKLFVVSIVTLLAALGNLGVLVAHLMGLF